MKKKSANLMETMAKEAIKVAEVLGSSEELKNLVDKSLKELLEALIY